MLLRIYLIISVLTFICMALTNLSIIETVKNKYKKELDELETQPNVAEIILVWLKVLIISFIPVYNVMMLLCIIFIGNDIAAKTNEYVEDALKGIDYDRN